MRYKLQSLQLDFIRMRFMSVYQHLDTDVTRFVGVVKNYILHNGK